MKTYHQFSEDIEQRRIELRQRSRDQMQRFKEKSKTSVDAQRQRTSDADNQDRRDHDFHLGRDQVADAPASAPDCNDPEPGALPDEPFADSLILIAFNYSPTQLYTYAQSTNSIQGQLINRNVDNRIKAIVKLSKLKNALLFFPFLDDLINGKQTIESISKYDLENSLKHIICKVFANSHHSHY